MRAPLARELRGQLERAVVKAREIAEQAAGEELRRLSVGEQSPASYLTEEQRKLRNRLRAHGRQLGDFRKPNGEQAIDDLVSEVAYEHWHCMLFARFLAENNLLMYEDGVTPLAINDCFDLAEEETGDRGNGWKYASKFAAKMLPQIFKPKAAVFEIVFAPNHQKKLEQLLSDLSPEIFQASDSLGWVYQFWQSKRKDDINQSEVKIGADELPAVTQLFTEHYMVSFLLDNSLGAWWQANHADKPCPVPLSYLRTKEDGEPASGNFDAWPKGLSELKVLDPSCGSGHFLVAAFLMLVPMRMAAEGLNEEQATRAVLRDNLYGLELEQRCIELAVFALALEAWRYPNTSGYRPLPDIQLACSGLAVRAAKAEWKQLGLNRKNLTIALDWMHDTFRDAPVLGSLINPARTNAAKIVEWRELSHALNQALDHETDPDPSAEKLEATVVAQGLAKAATLLADRYHLVITNVPYLARGKQDDKLKDFCELNYPEAKNDLATVFLDRCLEFCVQGGTASIVLPQNWLFLPRYKKFREKLLKNETWHLIARLGPGAFETISGEVVKAILVTLSHDNDDGLFSRPDSSQLIYGVDVSDARTAGDKAEQLLKAELKMVGQQEQLKNPDNIVSLDQIGSEHLLSEYARAWQGIVTSDDNRYFARFWEVVCLGNIWESAQQAPNISAHMTGKTDIIRWEQGIGALHLQSKAHNFPPQSTIGKKGIAIQRMGGLNIALYDGVVFDDSVSPLIPQDQRLLPALWCYCNTASYVEEVRKLNQSVKVVPSSLMKVAFDLNHWSSIAKGKYPNGLPEPYSNDATQRIFHGHPCGSVVWDDESKWTAVGSLQINDSVLQVAVARLLGYRWPAELDAEIELADEQRAWVEKTKALNIYADDDGIACLSAVRGEKPASERLEELLHAAYGDAWSTHVRNRLLEAAGCKSKGLNYWLQTKFFEQHCKTFQNRPFIWHIWDGLNDGFSALVNYHLLDRNNLERLIYTYLDDWIRTQKHQQADCIDGAIERLSAAEGLKQRLELILKGEAPYDIFVRWKPVEKQPIGWNPDINDGVRLNIRPFMSVADVGKKGAGIMRSKPNIHWKKDRGKDVESAPWYRLGLEYGGKEGDRINDHHLTLAVKQAAEDGNEQ